MPTRGIPTHRRHRKADRPFGGRDWTDVMDWTGTRMRSAEGVGELTLTSDLTPSYARGEQGVVDFVHRYAHDAIARLRLRVVVVKGADGGILAEIVPPPRKVPF